MSFIENIKKFKLHQHQLQMKQMNADWELTTVMSRLCASTTTFLSAVNVYLDSVGQEPVEPALVT